jgi:extradiol dioxygenase family protein
MNPFHLAIPVEDIERCKSFYIGVLGCSEGRSDTKWIDLNLFGHQLVLHEIPGNASLKESFYNPVDGHEVPIPHFGVVLDWNDWMNLADRLKLHNIEFIIEPYIRFKGKPGEQATMFFLDPEGNALEFKSFRDLDRLFAK